jgi:hypothetical protein
MENQKLLDGELTKSSRNEISKTPSKKYQILGSISQRKLIKEIPKHGRRI